MVRRARPPGPRHLPLLGSLPAFSRDPLGFLCQLASYGDVAYTTVGPSVIYMLNDPLLIEEALVGRHRECLKDFGTRELVPLVGNGLLTSEGDVWKKQRRLASPPLSPKRIASYADTMVACAERSFAAMRDEQVRDVHVDMMTLTLEIVGKTLLGVDTRGDAERVARIVEVAMAYFDRQLFSWHGLMPQWFKTPERIAFRKAVGELDRVIYRIIARCRTTDPDADHLLARLMNARDEQGEAMSDEQLRDEAVTMLLAGHETTAIALSYAVFELSSHPEVRKRLGEEVDRQLGGRPATLADLSRLPYLDAVMRETLRLYPPAWLMGRQIAQPFEIGGYALVPGEQIMMSPYVVQRDARLYAEPRRFWPERWLSPPAPPLPRFAYFPFGGGPRVCIGNHFAMMEIALVLATLMQQVELTVVPGFELKFAPVVTLRPARGVPVLVRRRGAAPPARRSPWSERAKPAAQES